MSETKTPCRRWDDPRETVAWSCSGIEAKCKLKRCCIHINQKGSNNEPSDCLHGENEADWWPMDLQEFKTATQLCVEPE